VQSSLTRARAKTFLENIGKGVVKDTVEYNTYFARLNLLHHISRLNPVSIPSDYLFPLPPFVEQERLFKMAELKAAHLQLVETVRLEDELGGQILENFNRIQTKRRELEAEKKTIETEIYLKSGSQSTKAIYLSGNNPLNIFASTKHTFSVPVSTFRTEYQSWQCEFTSEKERIGDRFAVHCNISPDFLTIEKKNGVSWFIRLWISWSGTQQYGDELKSLTTRVSKLKLELSDLQRKIEKETKASSQDSVRLKQHKEVQAQMEQILDCLSSGTYTVEQIPSLVSYLGDRFKPD